MQTMAVTQRGRHPHCLPQVQLSIATSKAFQCHTNEGEWENSYILLHVSLTRIHISICNHNDSSCVVCGSSVSPITPPHANGQNHAHNISELHGDGEK